VRHYKDINWILDVYLTNVAGSLQAWSVFDANFC